MLQPSYYQTVVPTARGMMAMLAPLTGTRATGKLLLTAATGQSALVPRSAYCYPIVGSDARPELLFKVAIGPGSNEEWNVPDTGLTVDVLSNLGGAIYNLQVGTRFVFDPPIAHLNVTTAAPLCNVAFTGGAPLNAPGALRDVVFYDQLKGPVLSKDLARSALKAFPAAVIAWEETQLIDGVTTPITNRQSRAGVSASLYKLNMDVMVVTSRNESAAARRAEGLTAMDAVAALLLDRTMVDGECMSSPSAVQLRRMVREDGPQELYQAYYVYHVGIACCTSITPVDDRAFADLLLAVVDTYKPQDVPLPNQGDFHVISDQEIPMSDTAPHPGQYVSPSTRYLTTFTYADLVLTGPVPGGSAKLYLNHNLGSRVVDVVIRNNAGVVVPTIDEQRRTDDNNEVLDLGSLCNPTPIPGTWTVMVLSGGMGTSNNTVTSSVVRSAAYESSFTYAATVAGVITIQHDLDRTAPPLVLVDVDGDPVITGVAGEAFDATITYPTRNTAVVDMSGVGAFTGTINVSVG